MGIRAGHESPRLWTQLLFVWEHNAVVSSHHVLINELTAFLAGLRPPWGPFASQFTGGTTRFPWGRAEQQGERPSLYVLLAQGEKERAVLVRAALL